ncbi:DUF262 domain-containing protein [Flavobacterium sp. Arc3]|uniref:DUF262 domain-containing protein n=1 Tax=Flavobacterium sp. Arc3 TaxID=3046686 RepID=UPI00352D2B73
MSNTIKLFSISELLERNFYIPSYQRGYRWTKQQVEDLLNDIYAFAIRKKADNEFYCLQPVVVKPHKWERTLSDGNTENTEGWELVDGQQRLTTIRVLFTYLIKEHLKGDPLKKEYGKDVFKVEYETREDTERFLNSITENNTETIDYYHISNAYKHIREWFEKQESPRGVREAIINTLVYAHGDINNPIKGAVQVIWYQIEDGKNPIDTFIRINLGKISLTNSELIKALFLQEGNFGADKNELAKLRQLEIANEWDRIENALQDDDFWWFLNRSENKKASRIEFIFDIICAVAQRHQPDIIESIGTDKYATFRYFYQRFDGKSDFNFIKNEWSTVAHYFNTFLEWYNNPVWYHYIGFLIYCSDNIVELFDLTDSNTNTKNDITEELKKRVEKRFQGIKWAIDENKQPYLDLSYAKPKQKQQIKELLLLLNIQYVIEQCESKSIIFKFPYKSFKEEQWDVEHIDSFTENPLSDKPTQIEWIITAKSDLQDTEEFNKDLKLAERIKSFIEDEKSKESFELIQGEIIRIAGEETNDELLKNNIGNLTLLDAETNRSYGNSLFPTKRRIIIDKDMNGTFIPIWTKNLFLKYFDLKAGSRTKWNESDIKKYRNIIADKLEAFLPSKP